MKLETLYKKKRTEDLNKMLATVCALNDEHGISSKQYCLLTDSPLPNSRYLMASSTKGYIDKYWFTYGEEDDVFGLAYMTPFSTDVVCFAEPKYLSFTFLADETWLCLNEDKSYDLRNKEGVVISGIYNYDVIQLSNCIACIQLDSEYYRHLVCADMRNLGQGCFYPSSWEDFSDWFTDKIIKYGYEGYLDNVSMSQIMQYYFEVKACIFDVGNFQSLSIA